MLNNKTLLKILSILIALGMWVMVVSGHEETKEMTVPVRLINIPQSKVAISDFSNVSINIKGAARLMQSLTNSDVLLDIDVSGFTDGQSIRRILTSDFKTPLGLEVADVNPSELRITLDNVTAKEVRVLPSIIGEVKQGYMVESITLKPNSVTVTGAKTVLSQLENISTMPINLSERNENFVQNVLLKEYDGVTKMHPSSVEVRVKLRENMIEHEFTNVPVECMNLKSNLMVSNTPSLSYVKARGREDIIDTFLDTVTFVTDCSHINGPGTYKGSVAYRTNFIVDILNLEPQTINIE
ncbi:MAG: CdaR family protein, partial [Candidatus Mucispirillum faecigallinarum]|nr:CdaR family protein [Candidatus Mucispirillum faecigallinarum]